MPTLILLGAFLFCFWIYRQDARTHPGATSALWLPTLWMMRCGSRSIDAWIGGSDSARLDPVFVGVMLLLGLIALSRRPCNWGQIFGHNSALFLFYGYLFISVLWANTLDNPAIKILRPAGDLIMALIVASEPDPRASILTVFRRTAILLIPVSIVLIRYFHNLGTMQDKHEGLDQWVGVTTHKNPLGQLCLVSILAFFWNLADAKNTGQKLSQQRITWVYLAMSIYLMNGGGDEASRSSTSILCLVIALALFFGFGWLRRRIQVIIRTMVLCAVALGVLALVLQFFGSSLQAVVAGSTGKDVTLSDRTYLWQDVIRIGMENPILGSGYGGFWVPSLYSRLSPIVDNHPLEAHNGYLETFANLGGIGVGLLLIALVQAVRSGARVIRAEFEYGRLRLVLIFMVIVMNYSEATFTVGTHLWWFSFLVVALYARPWVAWPEEPDFYMEDVPEEESSSFAEVPR